MTLVERVRTIIVAVFLALSLLQNLFHSGVGYRVEKILTDHDPEHARDSGSNHDSTSPETHLKTTQARRVIS